MCETLMSDVMAPEANQNDRSYERELSGHTFDSHTQEFSVMGGYTENLKKKKKHKIVKIGGWALAGDNAVVMKSGG